LDWALSNPGRLHLQPRGCECTAPARQEVGRVLR